MPRPITAALVAGLLLVSACGDDGSGTAETEEAPTTTAAAPVEEATFPVTVTAENGDVEVAAQPERIVSLSGSLTEMLYAIEAGDQVVAVDEHSDFPAGTPVTDLSGFSPNVEAIGGYEPDLVIVSRDRDGIADALGGLGIPTLVLSSADTLEDVYREIGVLGTATGHEAEAEALTEDLRAELDELAATVPDRDAAVRYFYELSDDLSTVTSETFIGELLSLAGMVSIADGADPAAGGFPQLSNEFVISADPDVIFLAHTDGTGLDPAEVSGRPGWSELRAAQDGDVVVLDADISTRWGPRIVELLRAVIDATTGSGR